jgi:GPH family glycoside/pentoside/hexuronide:cation symporter
MAESLSTRRRLLFALGNPGYQITDRIVVLMTVYFYLPPPDRGLEPQVPESTSFGFVTVFGLAMLVGRIFDTAADPVVGFLSDRSRSRFGRRRVMLMAGVLPMVVLPALLFFPPFGARSAANGVWLAGLLALYFVAFTAYVAPYFALIPELAWTQPERLRLSQLMQIASIPVMGAFSAWGLGLDLGRSLGLSPETSVRWVVIGTSALALLLALGPIVAVDEERHARGTRSELAFRESLLATLRNRPFLLYLCGQIFFVMGVNLVQPVLPYLATVVLGRSEGFTVTFVAAMGAGIALGFLAQRRLEALLGAKRLLIGCIALAAVAVSALGLVEPAAPGSPQERFNLWVCFGGLGLFGVPVAGLMALPHVIISQLVDADERRTGASRAAMFFGVQGLLTKWVYGLSAWAFTFLLARYGNSPEEPWGVIAVGPAAGLLCLAGLGFYVLYPERSVLAEGARGAVRS